MSGIPFEVEGQAFTVSHDGMVTSDGNRFHVGSVRPAVAKAAHAALWANRCPLCRTRTRPGPDPEFGECCPPCEERVLAEKARVSTFAFDLPPL